MKFLITFVFVATLGALSAQSFKSQQLQKSRVAAAYKEKGAFIDSLFKSKSITKPEVYIRAFKKEMILEVWAKNKKDTVFQKLIDFDFCSSSGGPGPKRQRGDMQIPEGFYYIKHFNPYSNFHLSLGISYPNDADRKKTDAEDTGGDIYMHGNCVTIGCIPITDNKIKELYIIAVEARNNGQRKVPVHIFPCKMEGATWEVVKANHSYSQELLDFWKTIEPAYHYFEKTKKIPPMLIDDEGNYYLKR